LWVILVPKSQNLLFTFWRENSPNALPVLSEWKSCRDSDKVGKVVEFLAEFEVTADFSHPLVSKLIESFIQEPNRVAVFFDGFDEINTALQKVVIQMLQILCDFTQARVFISSRLDMENKLTSNFASFCHHLAPLTEPQQVEFLINF